MEVTVHCSQHGCHGNRSKFTMYLDFLGFFGCLFLIWTTAKSHFWNQTQFIYVLTFLACICINKTSCKTDQQIHKRKDGIFPSISLNQTCSYSNTLTLNTANKSFSCHREMLCLSKTADNKVHPAPRHHDNILLLLKEGLRNQIMVL